MKKIYRVKKSEEIENIIKERKYCGNSLFILYKKNNYETKHFRYAVSVGKKIGNAVMRNKVKRQVRAIVDNLGINLDLSIDVFIIVKQKVTESSFEEMKCQLEYLFKKQKLI